MYHCKPQFYCIKVVFKGIKITSLGEERANLSAFRTFVRFVLVWVCRFSLPLGVWGGGGGGGGAAVCDCGTPWTFLLLFFYIGMFS